MSKPYREYTKEDIYNLKKENEKLKFDLQLEKDNVAELNELLIAEKRENENLEKENRTLKNILSYPKYTNEEAYDELLKLSNAKLIKMVIESHQHGESVSQNVYAPLKKENEKYKNYIKDIERILKINIQECIDNDDCYRARKQMQYIIEIINTIEP